MIGFTPQDIDGMSMWQFQAAVTGYSAQFDDGGMTESEATDLFDWLQSQNDVPLAHMVH